MTLLYCVIFNIKPTWWHLNWEGSKVKHEWDEEFHALSESELLNVVIVDFCRARWRLATRWKTVQIPPYLATEDGKYYMFQRHPWDRRLSQVLESNFGLLSKLEVRMNADGQGCSNFMWVLVNQIALFLSLVWMECLSWAWVNGKGIYTNKNENMSIDFSDDDKLYAVVMTRESQAKQSPVKKMPVTS